MMARAGFSKASGALLPWLGLALTVLIADQFTKVLILGYYQLGDASVVTGFFNYHAVPTNSRTLVSFRYRVAQMWRRTLRRRSQKDNMTWERMTRLIDDWLPKPRVLHPWPNQRFAVKHPR